VTHHVFYHSADLDGHCSGALVRIHLERIGKPTVMHGIDYGDPFPWGELQMMDTVWMVDWTLQPLAEFDRLDEVGLHEVVVIDHHKTSLPLAGRYSGIIDTGRAACEWTERYLHFDLRPAIELLGRYDSWRKGSDWEDAVLPYQYGVRTLPTDPATTEGMATWRDILGPLDLQRHTVESLRERGRLILDYQRQVDAVRMKQAFECKFADLWAIASIGPKCGSQAFASVWNPSRHDCMASIGHDGPNGLWAVSLYTEKPGLDLTPIAKRFGGGGHPQACGFQVPCLSALGIARREFSDSSGEIQSGQVQ